ncbi:ABC transporter ATP-binding protein [Leptolyngbya sp. AN02str]|uniref:ABC transporter ATP-binding protein n=1 Tax=Leptolyngbya sp. AN02str TaxID=3423363 RepID=UPI003D31B37C
MGKFTEILRFFRGYQRAAVLSILATSFFQVADLAVPYATGQILNVLSQQPVDPLVQGIVNRIAQGLNLTGDRNLALMFLLGVIFITTVVRGPIQPWLTDWYHWDIALSARRDNTGSAVAKILSLPLEFYDENNPGRVIGRVAKGLSNHTWTYPEIAGQLIPKLFRIVGIFVVIWLIEWRIAVLFLVSFVVILQFTVRNLTKLTQQEKRLDRHMENTESRTSEIITNIKTVKAFGTEAHELKRQRQRLDRELKYVLYRIHVGYVALFTQTEFIVQSCVFGILALTLWATVRGQISLGHFITTLTVSSMAYSELEPISNLAEVFARRFASMVRFHEFMHIPNGEDAAILDHVEGTPRYEFTGKVHLEHVSFGYERDRPVLQDINLLIEPRQTVALVGRSGSGKSTLVKLLFRYFEPSSGRILIDGHDVRSLDITGYRKRLAIVHQEVDVFNGTLLDNLTYGNPTATVADVEQACAIARVDEFIHLLPNGLKTIVGERGVRLSGGQRQRLGIARALLVNPDVLVFDEATSSLDYESERSIQLAMRNILGTRTTIIIAHRLSTVREADKIVVLDKGRIAEVGSHDELLRHGGIYHHLHALQETGELLV